eukprot:CAMPEP_0195520898 /NCGR_PEP_ID=MMETSP0794_2-20130614/17608_1 /TAXON_ID=515487 /ORGANISM="Stephanopyxis turris, Strain CCMP 815" /LENGTH=100 /DNA_ID=CAMNT_0040650337 /DNA_START=183 /DNA_END=485 /DNA_ORIENTATION=+
MTFSSSSSSSAFQNTLPRLFAMKPGTPLAGLDIVKGKDAPVAKERKEYPDWVNDLAKPLTSLAELRRMDMEDATDKDMMRYLKLTRRGEIKGKNNDAGDS